MVITGLFLVATGVLWPWLGRIGLGQLPGDIMIEGGEEFSFYAPITTGILINARLAS